MPRDYAAMQRIPFDPRMVREISRSETMSREQGPDFLSGWGGPQGYVQMSKLPVEERLVYAAVLDGALAQSEIEIVTGLSSEEVASSLSSLEEMGLVDAQEVSA